MLVVVLPAYLLRLDIYTISFAPKDGHDNQIQFAFDRGIGAMILMLATKRKTISYNSFEMLHCLRWRVDWHESVSKFLSRSLRFTKVEF